MKGAPALLGALLMLGATHAAAQDPCAAPDPRDFGAVYACMQTIGPHDVVRRSCQSLRERYKGLLRNAGMKPDRALQYLPSCEMLVRVVSDLAGQAPSWAQCTGYPRGFDPEHFKRCLGPVAGNTSCQNLIDTYRQALMDADPYGQLPGGYSDPDCSSVARALAAPRKPAQAPAPERPRPVATEWAKCLDYDPANVAAHMKRCLGPDLTALTTCRAVQQAYERSLAAANNGLPQGYVTVPCPEAQPIVALAQEQIEQKRLAAAEKRLAEDRARRDREAKAAQMEAQLRDLARQAEAARQQPTEAAALSLPNPFFISLCFLAVFFAAMFEIGRRGRRLAGQEFYFEAGDGPGQGFLSRIRFAPLYLLAAAAALYWCPVELVIGAALAGIAVAIWRSRLETGWDFG